MSWYVVKGRSRLHVENTCTAEDWVMGPVIDYQDAFDWMERREVDRLKKGDAMRTLVTLAAVILMGAFAGMAMAEGDGNGGRDNSAASSSAVASAFGVAASGSISEGGSAAAEGGESTATGGNSNASGGQGGSVSYQEEKQFRNTPWVTAPSIQPTHPCTTTWSAGLGVPGAGGSFGKSKVVDECELRETSRLFYQYGETEYALALLCESEAVRASAIADQCPRRERQAVYIPGDCRSADERLERCQREALK